MRKWYYVVDGQRQGPIQEAGLIKMLSYGQLPPETIVWTQEMQDRAQVDQIKGLISHASSPPIPQPSGISPSPFSHSSPSPAQSAFLHIPISRLIVMSIASCGLYENYWIYKNWRYLKERDGLNIRPFWRGCFGILYCHSLLKTIYRDQELTQVQKPCFSPGGLATGWILLILVANTVDRFSGAIESIITFLIPSFLCFVPVQNYINSVNSKRNPNASHSQWSTGHTVCLILGLLMWGLKLVILIAVLTVLIVCEEH